MKIVILTTGFPATTSMPGSPRLFNLCRELSQRHELHLLCRPKHSTQNAEFSVDPTVASVFQKIIALPPPPDATEVRASWLKRQAHRLRLAPSFVTRFRYPKYWQHTAQAVSDYIQSTKPDLVYCDGLEMAQYIPWRSELPVAVDFCDSLTSLLTQQTRKEENILRRIKLWLEARGIARWERRISQTADLVIAISSVDAQAILQLNPDANTLVVPNGVDCNYFSSREEHAEGLTSQQLIFTGVMAYGPNEDAVRFFCEAVLPRVREAHPNAEFLAVGAEVSESLRKLNENQGVSVTGPVKDVRPFLEKSRVFVCPLRYGAGVKNKLLAAMAVGVPIVASSLSLSGIAATPDVHLLTADTPDDFVEKIDMLFCSADLSKKLAKSGRTLVEEHYAWAVHAEKLERSLQRLIAELSRF